MQSAEAGQRVPPSQFFGFGCGKPEAHSLSLGHLLYKDLRTSLVHPWYKERNSSHQSGGPHILMAYALTQSIGHSTRSSMVEHLGLAPLAAVDPVDEAVLVLGLAPPAAAQHYWSPSLFGTVISGCIGGLVAAGVLWASSCSSVSPSGHSSKPAKSAGNWCGSPRSSGCGRSNCTCLCISLLGGWAPSSGVPWLKEWGSHLSLCWGPGGLGEGETHLEGSLEGVLGYTLPFVGLL